MSDSPGVVRELRTGGRILGKTASLEGSFLEQAKARRSRPGGGVRDVYAVVGPDSSESFVERLREVLPVVVDEKAHGVALLIDGRPSEWTGRPDDAA